MGARCRCSSSSAKMILCEKLKGVRRKKSKLRNYSWQLRGQSSARSEINPCEDIWKVWVCALKKCLYFHSVLLPPRHLITTAALMRKNS